MQEEHINRQFEDIKCSLLTDSYYFKPAELDKFTLAVELLRQEINQAYSNIKKSKESL